jgi:hypothetical protein
MKSNYIFFSLFLTFYISSGTNAQNIWYINTQGSGSQHGTSWENASTNLQGAIDSAFNRGGGQVWVAYGTYMCNKLVMKKKVELYGGFSGTESLLSQRAWQNNHTILSGNGFNTVIYNNYTYTDQLDTTAIIDGFTITNGNNGARSQVYASGIFNNYASPIIVNCTLANNASWSGWSQAYGGAIYNHNSAPVISNCDFSFNIVRGGSGAFGGAICNSNSSPAISNCNFTSNTSDVFGGAIYNNNSSLTISNCNFISNAGYNFGGAIYSISSIVLLSSCIFENNTSQLLRGGGVSFDNTTSSISECKFVNNMSNIFGGAINCSNNSNVFISKCEFYGNSSVYGGGIYFDGSSGRIDNSLFAENFTRPASLYPSNFPFKQGGALFLNNSSPVITNSTIVFNKADSGSAVFCNANSNPVLTNCILYGNTGILNGQVYINQNSSAPKLSYCLNQGGYIERATGVDYDPANYTNNIDSAPQFADTSLLDYHLKPSSLCINSGTPDTTGLFLSPYDLDGNARVFGSRIDIGCYESDDPSALFEEPPGFLNKNLRIYPNPTNGLFSIELKDNAKIQTVFVINILGEIIEQIEASGVHGICYIDLTNKPKGLYFIKIKTNNGILTGKVVSE